VAIDTREQLPYSFPLAEVKTLRTGDYSIVGYEDRVAIQRKAKEDAYGSCGGKGGVNRRRFEAEFKRLSFLEYGAVVVEAALHSCPEICPHADWSVFVRPPFVQRMSGGVVVGTLLGWSVKYGVPVWFAGDRRHGNTLVKSLLDKWWHYSVEQTS
jgi:hypothetical protein